MKVSITTGLGGFYFMKIKRNKFCKKIIKHGLTKTKAYRSWSDMIRRCYGENSKSYKNYGGRGIKVHQDWLDSFVNFYNDMGECLEGLTLERKDVNKSYSPSNCIWADRQTQARNKRTYKSNSSGCKGVSKYKNSKKWVAYISVDKSIKYLGSFTELEEAVEARRKAEEKYWNK